MLPRAYAGGLLALVLALSTPALAQTARPSRLGPSTPIEDLRKVALEGDYVTVEGRITRTWNDDLFDLQDETGKMTVQIPEYLRRELGEPGRNERIRVRGKYDHAYLEPDGGGKPSNWGVRAEKLERNLPDVRRPTAAAEAEASMPQIVTPPPAPAAQSEMGSATPNAGPELVERLATARKRIDAARKASDAANARWARATYHKEPEGPARDAIEAERAQAEAELVEAQAAVGPLIEEARKAGVEDRLLELYEDSVTR